MKKDFDKAQLANFTLEKQFKALYDLARFIELNKLRIEDPSFQKLAKYHDYLSQSQNSKMQKLHKEFQKIKRIDYQFQIYLMLLERFQGQSLKEYHFLINSSVAKKTTRSEKDHSIVCVLDSIRSAHNVGTFFRNSECFGVDKLYLTGLTPEADHPQVKKTAMDTETLVSWVYQRDTKTCLENLISDGYQIIAIDTANSAVSIDDWRPTSKKLALVFGHEQFGLSLEVLKKANVILEIPMHGFKNSLNVGVCQGIILQAILSKI